MTEKKILALALLLLLGMTFVLMSAHLDAPFDSNHIGFTGAWYSLSAHNFLQYGPAELCFCMCIESGPSQVNPMMYLSHPAGVSLLLAGVFSLFGEGELQARGMALALSLVAALFFFLFQRRLFRGNVGVALFGTLLAVSAPVWAIYGSLIDPHGPGILLAMAGTLWATLRWSENNRLSDLVLANLFVAFGCAFDWAACLVAAPIGLWALVYLRDRAWLARLSFWVTAWVVMGFFFWMTQLAAEKFNAGVFIAGSLVARSSFCDSIKAIDGNTVAFAQVLKQLAIWHWKGFFLPLSLAGWLAALALCRQAKQGKTRPETWLILTPLFMGLVLLVFFMQAVYWHEYLQIYLAPGLAMALAWVLANRWQAQGEGKKPLALVAVTVLSVALGWGFYRSRLRWQAHLPGIGSYRTAAEVVTKRVKADQTIITNTTFCPPLSFYSKRRIILNVDLTAGKPDWLDTTTLGGILLKDTPGPNCQKLIKHLGFVGPTSLVGTKLKLWARPIKY